MDILKDIEKGEVNIVYCEPLADMPENLKWCPNREQCEELYDYVTSTFDCWDIIEFMQCDFCESSDWIIVGVTKRGSLLILLVTPEYGRNVKNVIVELRKEG